MSKPESSRNESRTFLISVAAELAGMHAQTLRTYDRLGLVSPDRSSGGGRRYSEHDVDLLREVQRLSQDEGVNLAGIKRIIELTNLTSTKIVSALVVSLHPSKQSEVLAVGIELVTPSESFWGATFRLKMATDDLLKLEKSIRSGGMDTRGAPGVSRRRRLRPQDLLGAARIARAPGPPTGYGHGAFPAH
jgi:DNA-binding transcriptional MerR regulator